jgi:hypothetical protein
MLYSVPQEQHFIKRYIKCRPLRSKENKKEN